jgi:hypothetical protein
VKKVVDTVNDLDNVLYEISKESGVYATAWQYHMIDLIHQYEAGKPKQHPVGMTFQHAGGSNAELFAGPADWISPSGGDGYQSDPPAADGRKVLVNDTDHSFFWTGLQKAGPAGQQAWVWTWCTNPRAMQRSPRTSRPASISTSGSIRRPATSLRRDSSLSARARRPSPRRLRAMRCFTLVRQRIGIMKMSRPAMMFSSDKSVMEEMSCVQQEHCF